MKNILNTIPIKLLTNLLRIKCKFSNDTNVIKDIPTRTIIIVNKNPISLPKNVLFTKFFILLLAEDTGACLLSIFKKLLVVLLFQVY